ncbi:hypothetical protein DSO57_1032380 [Entomophthora muscae]|uniref:Uncharacterized protein n=1 Tax=Entomophthora muscae TaxID=34485 RepID=A0ACC2RF32_9FUNG|nr:hypothetical protein DSO57_1032380 [Entomophthora muscae]
MLESPLRIIYLNVRALRTDKLERLITLYANSYDLIFLSETWFINFANMQNHPDFIIHTPIANFQTRTHQQAGIACFSRHFRSNIRRAHVTTYAVIIETTTLKMVGTYIPSSAPIEVFETTLNACPDVNLLFGDINVEFGPSWNGALQRPLDRFRAVSSFCANRDFRHVRPDDDNSPKLDHVFARMPVRCNFFSDIAPVDTDHPILFIEAFSPAISTEIPDFGLSQYYIRSLEHPCTCASLRGHFEAIVPSLTSLLTDALEFTSSMDIATKKSMVNELDELVLTFLASCCAPALGVYQVS